MRGGFESRDILRFPFERQHAPTIDNLRRNLPQDKAIRSLQYRFGQKRVTRATIFQMAYKDERTQLLEEEREADPHSTNVNMDWDLLFADGVHAVFQMLGEAQRAQDELARLTRKAVDAITEKGRFDGPDPCVEEADFQAGATLVRAWAAGIEMLEESKCWVGIELHMTGRQGLPMIHFLSQSGRSQPKAPPNPDTAQKAARSKRPSLTLR
ncbi:hypothetical protein [Asaia sp. As-1742]|uniref:hypothetical protein n=1 Tax=Asaia sp. As-1742 TaxID=2608325 RepID=UPI0014234895|nr:hypothetical protein [Asaia sp. As-1742]NIE81410.1 hypothetical protein [Asaia sp. As-1742]